MTSAELEAILTNEEGSQEYVSPAKRIVKFVHLPLMHLLACFNQYGQ
jgi:hypothetical protein